MRPVAMRRSASPGRNEAELRTLLGLAVPIMLSCMLNFLMNTVDLLFVGHLGRHELAAAAMGNALWATVALPLQGCASALDTFLSQSYGAKQFTAFGHWVQAATICMSALSVPVAAFLALAEPLLVGLGQDPVVASGAGHFCLRLIPGVPPFIAFLCLSKGLQAQNILAPAVYIALLANVLNCGANWMLIYWMGFGISGAPLATTFSRWAQLLLLLGYLYAARGRLGATLPSLHVECSQLPSRASRFFRLGAPGALMLALEAWSFDFSTLMAGYLGQVALDAHTIMLSIIAFTFVSFPLALGIAAAIRVGHCLGAGDAATARLAAKLTISLVLVAMTTLAIAKLCARQYLGRLFTDDDAVVAKVASLVGIAALFQVSDGLQAAVAGVLRGMGKQRLVAGLNFVGFWLIGLPTGACLTFVLRIGVAGLWWGLFAGLTSVATIGVVALLRTDWVAEAQRALGRVSTQDGKSKDAEPGRSSTTLEVEVVAPTPPTEDAGVRRPHTVV